MYRYGRQGSMFYQGQRVAKVKDWSLESRVDLLETTATDAIAPTFRPGQKDSAGSATLLYYRLGPKENGLQQPFTELLKRVHKVGAVGAGDRVRLELRVSDRPGDKIVCNVWITSATLGVAAGELASVPIRFQVDGDLIGAIS